MRFYLHEEGDSFETFKDRVAIVEHLLTPPVSISLIESNYPLDNALGKRAAREIVQSTTSLIVFVIIAATTLFAAIPYIPYVPEKYNIPTVLSVACFVIYIFVIMGFKWAFGSELLTSILCWRYRREAPGIKKDIKQEFIKGLTDSDEAKKVEIEQYFDFKFPSKKDTHRRRFAIYLASQDKRHKFADRILTNVPFSLRNIWLWTLIIGLCSLFIKKEYRVDWNAHFDNAHFQEFTADFLRILLIAVVAYVATNVINELLQLREQYVQGRTEMASLNTNIGISANNFKEINTYAERLSDRLLYMSGTNEVQKALFDLWEKFSEGQTRKPLDDMFKKFTNTMKEQFDIFSGKVTRNDVVNMWMLSSLNEYFNIASGEFKNHCWLTTRFQFFGKIINATVAPILSNPAYLDDFKEQYEIFTVLVLPPKRFFNYTDGKRSDKDWDEYIEINIKAKRAGLIINRHFLSLSFDVQDDLLMEKVVEAFGVESIDLEKLEFIQQLQTEYWFSGSPGTSPNSEPVKKGIVNGEYAYITVGNETDDPSQNGYQPKPLRTILNDIHCEDACKVIELKIPEEVKSDEEILKKFDDILWDQNTKKPLDYFAIRRKPIDGEAEGEWVLCYRTVYDKTFDFAKIEILYRESSQSEEDWNRICHNLNQVFSIDISSDGGWASRKEETGINIYPINTYS